MNLSSTYTPAHSFYGDPHSNWMPAYLNSKDWSSNVWNDVYSRLYSLCTCLIPNRKTPKRQGYNNARWRLYRDDGGLTQHARQCWSRRESPGIPKQGSCCELICFVSWIELSHHVVVDKLKNSFFFLSAVLLLLGIVDKCPWILREFTLRYAMRDGCNKRCNSNWYAIPIVSGVLSVVALKLWSCVSFRVNGEQRGLLWRHNNSTTPHLGC